MRTNKTIFKTPRRGWLGKTPIGSDYMEEVNERARKMEVACRDTDKPADDRQRRLPGF